MILIDQTFEILNPTTTAEWEKMMKTIEKAYRTCYRNEGNITADSYKTYLPKHRDHQASAEHGSITVLITASRAIQQEITRHRLASYSIESTRWVDYQKKGNMRFIRPTDWDTMNREQKDLYKSSCMFSEKEYLSGRDLKLPAQRARDFLPLAYASEIVMTANPREWRTFFNLRCAKNAHPDIQKLAKGILNEFCTLADPLFGDLKELLT